MLDCELSVLDLVLGVGCPAPTDLMMFTGSGTGITKTYTYNDLKACLNSFSITTVIVPDNTPDSSQTNTIQVDSQGNQWFCDSFGDLTKIEHQIIPETDPVFVASAAFNITLSDISNWNTAYGWGNHASQGYITLGSLSATSPLAYNNLTGAFSISLAGAAQNGYLSSTDWNTFNNKQATMSIGTINSISPKVANGAQLSAAAIIMQTADASYPGLVSIGAKTFAGDKTFNGSVGVGVTPTYKFDVAQTMVYATTATYRGSNVVLSGSPATAASTYAGYFLNSIVGIASDNRFGLRGEANTTSGNGVGYGVYGLSFGSNLNYGGFFIANGNASANRTHIGVFGQANNYTATGTTAIGGKFQINAEVNTTSSPKAVAVQAVVNFAPDPAYRANNKIFEGVTNGNVLVSILADGRTFLGGSTTPTAWLHLAAGAAAAGEAPIKLTSAGIGTAGLLTTEEAGTINYTTYGLWHGYAASNRHKIWHGKSGVTAPSTTIGTTIVNYFGSSPTNFLGTPNGWASIILEDGSTAKIPYYS